jgi:dihydrolipoamide dehydrogenase
MATSPTNSTAVLEKPAPTAPGAAQPQSVAQVRETPQPERKGADGADYDVAIIGSGPGGYVAAIRAAQLGLKTAIVEKGHLGGTCLNVGCIPTKAMLASVEAMETARKGKEYGFETGDVKPDYPGMQKRRDKIVEQLRGGVGMLMKKNGIDVLNGFGKLTGPNQLEVDLKEGPRKVTANNVIIATGSVVAKPPIPGSDLPGVVNSDTLLALPTIPKSMIVIGAGAVGLEWGDIFHHLGTKITVIELMGRILPPGDAEVARELTKSFQKKGFDILTGVGVKAIEKAKGGLSVRYGKEGAEEQKVDAEIVLIATGRWPFTDGLGLEKVGVQLERRSIPVDDQLRTKAKGVYAIGDVTPVPMLAHVASKGGEIAAEVIAGHHGKLNKRTIPSCVYTSPEVAWVGLTEEQAREQYGEVKVGRFQFRPLGRAMASGYKEGFVKVIADTKYGEILGVHMIGAHVTDLISEATLAMDMEATVEEIFHAMHAHPTLPEAFQEASLDAWDRAIHK